MIGLSLLYSLAEVLAGTCIVFVAAGICIWLAGWLLDEFLAVIRVQGAIKQYLIYRPYFERWLKEQGIE